MQDRDAEALVFEAPRGVLPPVRNVRPHVFDGRLASRPRQAPDAIANDAAVSQLVRPS